MFFKIFFVFSNVFFIYSSSFSYLNFKKNFYLNILDSCKKDKYFSNFYLLNNFNSEEDIFNYNNLKENEKLNLEKEINTNWAKRLFRFSAISVGAFPIAFFLGWMLYDLSYFFYKNMDSRYFSFSDVLYSSNPNFKYKMIISMSFGILVSLTIALVDFFI